MSSNLFNLADETFTYDLLERKLAECDITNGEVNIMADGNLHPNYQRPGLIKCDDSGVGFREFNSAIAYFNKAKAIMCEVPENVAALRNPEDPHEAGFIDPDIYIPMAEEWERKKINEAFKANYFKFTGNPDLADELLATGKNQLFTFNNAPWGVGNPPDFNDPHINLTGKILMVIREQLRRQRNAVDSPSNSD